MITFIKIRSPKIRHILSLRRRLPTAAVAQKASIPLTLRGGVSWRVLARRAQNAPTRTAHTPRSAINFVDVISNFWYIYLCPASWDYRYPLKTTAHRRSPWVLGLYIPLLCSSIGAHMAQVRACIVQNSIQLWDKEVRWNTWNFGA
jgi:molybdopterin/thiamine biosynthesis adenylyltransferase